MIKYKKFLEENGYDTSIVGSYYFIDLLEEIVKRLSYNMDISDIKEQFPNICLEYYHFIYEVSRFKFLDELEYFSKNGYRGDNDIENSLWNEPVIDKLIRLGNRYNQEKEEIDDSKDIANKNVFMKKRNCKFSNVF